MINAKRKSLINQNEYVQRNQKRLKQRDSEIEHRLQEQNQVKMKWERIQSNQINMAVHKWLSLCAKNELIQLIELANNLFNQNQVSYSGSNCRKPVLLQSLKELSDEQLDSLKNEFLTTCTSRKLELLAISIKSKYIQQRIFEIFRKLVQPGDIISTDAFFGSGRRHRYYESTDYSFLGWKDEFSFFVHRNSDGTTQVIEFNHVFLESHQHAWSVLPSRSPKKYLHTLHWTFTKYLRRFIQSNFSELQQDAKWGLKCQGGLVTNLSLKKQVLQNQLQKLSPIPVTLDRKKKYELYFKSEKRFRASNPFNGNQFLTGCIDSSFLFISVTSYKTFQTENSYVSSLCICSLTDSEFKKCFAHRQCALIIDILPLISQDLEMGQWQEFVHLQLPNFENSEIVQIVNDFIGTM